MIGPDRFNAAEFFVDRHVAEGRGSRTVFRSAGAAMSYGELAERVSRAGHALASLGVTIENRVVLILHDTPAFASTFWGALKLGAVAAPLYKVPRTIQLVDDLPKTATGKIQRFRLRTQAEERNA